MKNISRMTLLIVAAVGLLASGCAGVKRRPHASAKANEYQHAGIPQRQDSFGVPKIGADPVLRAGMTWPVKEGSISSFYGQRRRHFHEGIDIRANRGTPVFAAKEGTVLYSARRIKGYGNMIVVRHSDGLSTVYAHNKKNLVKAGDFVKQGQLIGLVGATGKATGPHLHFEIRKGELPQDPLLYLPQIRSLAVARNR